MKVERLTDAQRFLAEAEELLMRDEARHNLILGIAWTLRRAPDFYREPRFWLVRDGDDVVAAALRTPPYHLALAQPRDSGALAALAEGIEEELPGVVGAVPEVDEFASHRRAPARVTREQGVYALRRVADVPRASGQSREAGEDDYELVAEWFDQFINEVLPDEPNSPDDRERVLRARLAASDAGFTLWEDGGVPVSLSGYGSGTPNGMRIGPVYTPPEHRGRGYAGATVAAVSQALLDEGARVCLFTDQANPVSNALYERLGYRPLVDQANLVIE